MSLFHSDETSHVYACTRSVSFQIRSIKKPVTFFKNGCKKIVSITKCNEKNCLKRITLQKKLSASPKNGNPPPIKNNGPSLRNSLLKCCPHYGLYETS